MRAIRRANLALISVLAVAAFSSIAHAAALPLFSSADEIGHFDYAYQVWHRSLPEFYEGVVVEQVRGTRIPVQWVSQHPPLFYVMLAPVVGPLTDSGHILIAGLAARGVNIVIGIAATAASIWAARQSFPRSPSLTLSAGLVCAATPWLRGTAGAIYNDPLAILICALLFGVTARMIRVAPSRRTWLSIMLLAAAALLTRLSLVVVVSACLLALIVEALVRGAGRRQMGRWSGITGSALTSLGIVLTSGWFYLRNAHITGSFTGRHADWGLTHMNRTTRSIAEVAFDSATWPQLIGIFGTRATGWTWAFIMLVLVPSLIGFILVGRALLHGHTTTSDRAIGLLLGVSTVLVVAMQVHYATGGGAILPRYVLPVLLPIALTIGSGLISAKAFSFVALPLWSLGAAAVLARWWQTIPDFDGTHFLTMPRIAAVCVGLTFLAITSATFWIIRQRQSEGN